MILWMTGFIALRFLAVLFVVLAIVKLFSAIAMKTLKHKWDDYGFDHALAVLRNRFASGEISEAEYRERKAVLERS